LKSKNCSAALLPLREAPNPVRGPEKPSRRRFNPVSGHHSFPGYSTFGPRGSLRGAQQISPLPVRFRVALQIARSWGLDLLILIDSSDKK
jgi:hypothetical protein